MAYRILFRSKYFIFVPLVLALLIAVACGDDPTPTTAPTDVPAMESPTAAATVTPEPTAMEPKATPPKGAHEHS